MADRVILWTLLAKVLRRKRDKAVFRDRLQELGELPLAVERKRQALRF